MSDNDDILASEMTPAVTRETRIEVTCGPALIKAACSIQGTGAQRHTVVTFHSHGDADGATEHGKVAITGTFESSDLGKVFLALGKAMTA